MPHPHTSRTNNEANEADILTKDEFLERQKQQMSPAEFTLFRIVFETVIQRNLDPLRQTYISIKD